MKKISSLLALAGLLSVSKSSAISFDDIQVWTGSGTNRAALVIEWSVPESLTGSAVPVPLADKALVWGYRFNGTNVYGTQMLQAVLAADPKLYVAAQIYPGFGTFVQGIGYNLKDNGVIGIADGTATNFFPNGFQTDATVNMDAAQPLNAGDLYWGGSLGANWEAWREINELGGFYASPNRGTNAFWTPTDMDYFSAGFQGQWQLSGGLDDVPLADGSWVGLSVAAGEYEPETNAPYNIHKHAPISPDGTYVAYVCNTNDFAVQIVSTNNVYLTSPYNVPTAVLGQPTLKFIDHFGLGAQKNKIDRSKIIEPPYWTDPQSNNVITEINPGGQITVNMGRKIYDDPNNPYGVDLIVYGNSFYSASGYTGGAVTDGTDMGVAKISSGSASGIFGHATVVSVSQDGTNWFTYPQVAALYPDDSYRWDNTNHCWTEEQMNVTKPLNPTMSFPANSTVATALDQFIGASGGTGFDLKASGLPWIQYVRVSAASAYTVIDAISAVNPVIVGDALSITPGNLIAGMTNLLFQAPADSSQNLISLNFNAVSDVAKVSTVNLNEFSAFTPFTGTASSAYKISVKPVNGTNAISYLADIGLRAGENYSGTGNDLRVYQWGGTNWLQQPFSFNPTNNEVLVTGITNCSTFVVSQIVPPQLNMHPVVSSGGSGTTNGFAFQFTPVPNCAATLERSTDLVTWTPIHTFTATNAQPITLQDFNVPADKAFYRVRLNP